jgi:lipopolysaccharide export system protein LptA
VTDYTVLDNVGQTSATRCTGAVAADYSFPTYVPGAVTITKRPITVRAQSYTVTYGDAKPTVTVATYTGWVNSQDET